MKEFGQWCPRKKDVGTKAFVFRNVFCDQFLDDDLSHCKRRILRKKKLALFCIGNSKILSMEAREIERAYSVSQYRSYDNYLRTVAVEAMPTKRSCCRRVPLSE